MKINRLTTFNGKYVTLTGSIGLILSLLLFINGDFFAQALILFTLSAVALIIGISQLIEPEVSFELTQTKMSYFHRRGMIEVEWENIQRIDVVRVSNGLETTELPYIGIKLKRINPILDSISPRLATGLVSEQRSLLMTAAGQTDNETFESHLNHEFQPLTVNEERYRGVLAMFGRRCLFLDKHLGYHLYFPVDSLDRDISEFVTLLRQSKSDAIMAAAK